MLAPSHLPANRHDDLGGKWGVTHGSTHARLWQLFLWWSCKLMGLKEKRNSLSQTLTVNILLLSTPYKYGFDFPFRPFHVISPYTLFTVFLRTSLICYITKQRLSRLLSFVWCVLDCLCGTIGRDCLWLFGSHW